MALPSSALWDRTPLTQKQLYVSYALAREFARLRSAGFDGLAINFVDYLNELPYFAAEVLPRLERLGLRVTAV